VIELLAGVWVASLVGSAHCAGMCGAFVLLAGSPLRRQVAYHAGRLVTYSLLGALAGALGAALDLGGATLGVERLALALAGLALIAYGAGLLARLAGLRVRGLEPPARLAALYGRVASRLGTIGPMPRALAIGMLSTLLPCGWLYAFVVTAAGTGSAALGALAMTLFWAGSLPALAAVSASAAMLSPLRRRAPALAALALIAIGLVAVAGRVRLPSSAPGASEHAAAHAACGPGRR